MTKKIGIFLFGLMLFFMVSEMALAASFTNNTLVSSTADGAMDVVSADIDNDGDLDIISANYNENKIEWYENNDDGTFEDGVAVYAFAYAISTLDVGDFNQDGYIDIVLATNNGGEGEIVWLENNQDTTFSFNNWIYPTGNPVSVVHVADMDNDGDMDVIGGLEGDGLVVYFENNGSGIFAATATMPGANVADIEAYDFDNDGWLDLIIALGDSVNILINSKQDSFSPPIYGIGGLTDITSVHVAELNGDGFADVLTTHGTNLQMHIFTGGGFLPPITIDSSLDMATSVKTVDIDNDGDLDVIGSGHTIMDDDIFQLYYNNGAGSFSGATSLDVTPTWVSQFVVDDFDTDGDKDIVYVTFNTDSVVYIENDLNEDYTMTFHENGGDLITEYEIVNDNIFTYDSQIDTDKIHDTQLFDINYDGFIDIVRSSMSTDNITALIADGSGGYTNTTILSVNNPSDFWIGDLNGDGDYDIVTINDTTHNVVWFMGDGSGGFTEKIIETNVTEISDVIVDDYDNDGDLDVMISLSEAKKIQLYLNNNDDTFTTKIDIDVLIGDVYSIRSIDLDNDGDLDLISQSNHENKLYYYLNNGNGSFNSKVTINTFSNDAAKIEIGDLNNDGWMDIVLLGDNCGDLYIFINNQDLSFTESQTIQLYSAGNNLELFDADNDGDLDIITVNGSTGTKVLFNENDGTGSFSTYQLADNTAYITNIDIVDVNSDGTPDLILSSLVSGTHVVLNEIGQIFEIDGPTYTGYTFDGWYSDSGLSVPFDETAFLTGDEEIWADWTLNTWTLTYEDHDGTPISSGVFDYGESLSGAQPADPTRTGYSFVGWSPSTPSTMPDNDLTITAVYDANYYTITHFDWDGSIVFTDDYLYESDLSSVSHPDDPVRAGYTFDGWDTVIPGTMPANNIDITALYTHTEYTINFEDHDGTLIDSHTFFYDDDTSGVIAPADPFRTGYTFYDWDTLIPSTMAEENIVATALYDINSYTIEYFEDDGSTISITTYEYGEDLTGVVAPTPSGVTGHHFINWDTTLPSTMPAYNIEVNPNFEANEHFIDYIDFDESVIQSTDTIYGEDLSTFVYPSDPTRVGYSFDGWDITLPGTMPDDNIIVTATYVKNTYTVTYYEKDGSVLNVYTFDYDEDLSSHTQPVPSTVTGYTFTDWDSSVPSNMPANNIDIHPTYTKNSYTVEYQDHDGTVLKTETFEFEADLSGFVLPSDPTRIYYDFDGWDSTLPSTMPASNIVVTATYTQTSYYIEYLNENGTRNDIYYFNESDDLTTHVSPTEETIVGYTFTGWDTVIPGTMPGNNIIVTAEYLVNSYTIEYRDHDGTVISTETIDYELSLSSVTIPSNPTREGYTFDDWDTVLPSTMANNDIIVTALYNINSYPVTFADFDGAVLDYHFIQYNTDLTGFTYPADPTRVGYTFTGWSTTLPSNMTSGEITLTAIYTINSFTVTYEDSDGTVIYTEDCDYGDDLSSFSIPTDPAITGYIFEQWSAALPSTMPNNDIIITAEYIFDSYYIQYLDNDGNVIDTFYYDMSDNVTLTISSPVDITGYTFTGWDTPLPTTMPSNNIIISPIYEINEYSVTFNINGVETEVMIEYNSIVTDIPETEITGLQFDGFTLNGELVDLSTFTVGAENIYLIATYTDIAAPVIEGVIDTTIYESGTVLDITFNEGTATLNGEVFTSGTQVSEAGEYTIIVTDEALNITTLSFTIDEEESSNVVVIVVAGGATVSAGGVLFWVLKKKFLF